MAKVTATDADGNNVEVIEAKFNNLGGIESILVKQNGRTAWRHAHEFNVTVDENAEHVGPTDSGVMTKNTMLDDNRADIHNKAELTTPVVDDLDDEPIDPAGELINPVDPIEPVEPVDPENLPSGDGDGQDSQPTPPADDVVVS